MIDPVSPTLSDYALLRDQATRAFAAHVGPVACGPGCSACCYQFIAVNFTDALLIAKHLLESGRATLDLLAKLTEMASAMAASDPVEWLRLNRACAFLADDTCSIYEQRPLNCRQVLVRGDASRCTNDHLYQIAKGRKSRSELPDLANWTELVPVGVAAQRCIAGALLAAGIGDLPPAPMPNAVLAALHFLVTGSTDSLRSWRDSYVSTQPTTPGENGSSSMCASAIQPTSDAAGKPHSTASCAP